MSDFHHSWAADRLREAFEHESRRAQEQVQKKAPEPVPSIQVNVIVNPPAPPPAPARPNRDDGGFQWG